MSLDHLVGTLTGKKLSISRGKGVLHIPEWCKQELGSGGT
ncbi:Uncharacterised protein [Vibrio cholerae]|nr:Uncharacterised protein [Vibrio cholerae]